MKRVVLLAGVLMLLGAGSAEAGLAQRQLASHSALQQRTLHAGPWMKAWRSDPMGGLFYAHIYNASHFELEQSYASPCRSVYSRGKLMVLARVLACNSRRQRVEFRYFTVGGHRRFTVRLTRSP